MTDENVIDDSVGDGALQGTDDTDTFVFAPGNGDDTITGFTDGQDLIDLSAFPTISSFYDLIFSWGRERVSLLISLRMAAGRSFSKDFLLMT